MGPLFRFLISLPTSLICNRKYIIIKMYLPYTWGSWWLIHEAKSNIEHVGCDYLLQFVPWKKYKSKIYFFNNFATFWPISCDSNIFGLKISLVICIKICRTSQLHTLQNRRVPLSIESTQRFSIQPFQCLKIPWQVLSHIKPRTSSLGRIANASYSVQSQLPGSN